MFALGVLLPHDVHDPSRGHEREGQNGEDDDKKSLDEIDDILYLRRFWTNRSGQSTPKSKKNEISTKQQQHLNRIKQR